MSSRRSTRYRNPQKATSFASAVSGSEQKKTGRNSISAPLSGENQQERRARVRHHGSSRKLLSAHPINALKTFVRKHLIINKKSKCDHNKSKCAPTIDTTLSQSSDTPPSSPPPLTTLPPSPQDIRLFDFEGGSTNQFKSLDSANAVESDDLSSSDDGVNLWDLASTQDTEEIDHLLTQIMNNSSMYIRHGRDSIKGKEQSSPPQNMDNNLSISPDYEDDTCVDTTEDNEPSDAEEDSIPDVFTLDKTATSLNVAERANMKDEDVDSALAWSALSLLLGSPAPVSVTRKSSRKQSAKLWEMDAGAESDDIPDLPTSASEDSLECVASQRLQVQAREAEEEGIIYIPDVFRVSSFLKAKEASPRIDQNDTFTTASLTSSDDSSLSRSMSDFESTSALDSRGDEEEDSIPDIFTLDKTATSLNAAVQTDVKDEDVDSALAWSALSFFLGSPAPESVTRKSSRKQSAKLWDLDAGAESDDIPDLPALTSEDSLECVTY